MALQDLTDPPEDHLSCSSDPGQEPPGFVPTCLQNSADHQSDPSVHETMALQDLTDPTEDRLSGLPDPGQEPPGFVPTCLQDSADLLPGPSALEPVLPKFPAACKHRRIKDQTRAACFSRPTPVPFDEIYEVGDELGQGGFGTVYEGTSKNQRKKVAIKIIHKCERDRYIELPGCSKPLFAEVAANLLLKQAPLSPYIVYMLEWFEEEDRFILILEHPEPCKDLLKFVVNNMHWANELQTRSLMYQAVLGAKHCLDRGVFHRDIKLNNFLINTTTNRVQLIDFGCSDLVKSTGYLGGFIGGVCPPEYYNDLRYKAEPTTVWSLGVMMYTMMCKCRPFRSPEDMMHGSLSFNVRVSTELQNLISRCLTVDPTKRATIEEILQHKWFFQQSSTYAWSQFDPKDFAGVDVDADIFDELVRTSKVSFRLLDGDKAGKKLVNILVADMVEKYGVPDEIDVTDADPRKDEVQDAYTENLALFYLALEAKHLVPVSTITEMANEMKTLQVSN
ncbi:LOW QUALITY PROTEIN: serine/threonine-protein kinase pim-1-like [Puntigrus tetrazona]|uniref:LOW QUALITY PROTEIN: serine/threonine-protein kinase pim-1-like n=1 Tax=Puntigrus tetrazona TaxID=1606681 RepID=UPI001C89F244|nr:LOW QUALITY PROTEIN: serine/threonine-protein kinase pim-1-like [Puntigrus tetrazona]